MSTCLSFAKVLVYYEVALFLGKERRWRGLQDVRPPGVEKLSTVATIGITSDKGLGVTAEERGQA